MTIDERAESWGELRFLFPRAASVGKGTTRKEVNAYLSRRT